MNIVDVPGSENPPFLLSLIRSFWNTLSSSETKIDRKSRPPKHYDLYLCNLLYFLQETILVYFGHNDTYENILTCALFTKVSANLRTNLPEGLEGPTRTS